MTDKTVLVAFRLEPELLKRVDRFAKKFEAANPFLIERSAVKAILEHLRLPTTGPPVAPARGSPQMELMPWPDVPDDSPQSP